MEEITPFIEKRAVESIDGTELVTKLKFSTESATALDEKLSTYLKIRPIEENYKGNYLINGDKLLVKRKNVEYKFNKIFDETTQQKQFYKECGEPLVRKFIEGYNCLIFAYGTTSSGKSYTMRGNVEQPGIIPRSIKSIFNVIGNQLSESPLYKGRSSLNYTLLNKEQIFNEINIKNKILKFNKKPKSVHNYNEDSSTYLNDTSLTNNEQEYLCYLSFVDVYNDNLSDLLVDVDQKAKTHVNNDGHLSNSCQIYVASLEEALNVYHLGYNNLQKHIESTKLNYNSSRSHAIFIMTLFCISKIDKKVIGVSNLAFCDLAGTERSKKTESKGDRLKEANKINQSLLYLKQLFRDVRSKQIKNNHNDSLHFGNSKLTRLFKPFLTGSAFASMIININPSACLIDETIGSLDFSSTACEIVISNDDSRKQIIDSRLRISQKWLNSKERWSQFRTVYHPIGETISEENGEDFDENLTKDIAQIEDELKSLENIENIEEIDNDLAVVYIDHIDSLNKYIDDLNKKIENLEDDQLKKEIQLRQELVNYYQAQMNKNSDEYEQNLLEMKSNYDKLMMQRHQLQRDWRKEEERNYEHKIEQMELELFSVRENATLERETFISKINELEMQLENKSYKATYEDKETQIVVESKEQFTSTEEKVFEDKSIHVFINSSEQFTMTEQNIIEDKSTQISTITCERSTETNDNSFYKDLENEIILKDKKIEELAMKIKEQEKDTTLYLKRIKELTDSNKILINNIDKMNKKSNKHLETSSPMMCITNFQSKEETNSPIIKISNDKSNRKRVNEDKNENDYLKTFEKKKSNKIVDSPKIKKKRKEVTSDFIGETLVTPDSRMGRRKFTVNPMRIDDSLSPLQDVPQVLSNKKKYNTRSRRKI